MEDKIQAYRQPLVTATGIILGFILNFASTFVRSESTISHFFDHIIGSCILIGIILLIVVLYRVLNMKYPRDRADQYYYTTLRYFICGVSISFVGVIIDMFANFLT
ncbi:MAG: hypothetical protein ACM3PT_13400 [Deltaproteobacteria bacterium]